MGFPENQKLAKDINTVNTECADRLGALITQMSGRMDTANRILEGIAAREDRYIYTPSTLEQNTVLDLQSEDFEITAEGTSVQQEFVCDNTFDALYDGSVTLYADFLWTSNGWNYPTIRYKVTQIYPTEVDIISGGFRIQETTGDITNYLYSGSVDFNVVKDGRYRVTFILAHSANKNGRNTVSIHGYIRSIVQFVESSSTKYYYPAEGAPTIVELNKEYTYPEEPSFNSGRRDIYLFTPEVSGAVNINIDILGYTKGNNNSRVTFTIKDSTGTNSLGAITSADEKHVRYRFTVLAGEPYNLTVGYSSDDVISIGNISISAVKTTALPLKVPFVPVNEPYQLVQFTSGNQIKQGYVVAKLPESIYKTQPHFLIAMQGDVYPGNKTGSAEMVLYDVLNGKQDYRLDYDVNDTDHVSREERTWLYYGTYYSRYFVYIATIDGEVCVVVELTDPASQPIQKVAKEVGYISATLF